MQKIYFRILENLYLTTYYNSIDNCPILIWDKITQTGDLKYLLKRGKVTDSAIKHYENINAQLIDNFGISDKYFDILRLRIKIEQMWLKVIDKDERYLIAQIQPLERELETKMKVDLSKSNIRMSLMAIEKNMSIKLNYNKVTIREFYDYCKFLEEINKQYKDELSKKSV